MYLLITLQLKVSTILSLLSGKLSSADLRFPFFFVHFIQSIFRIGMADQGCSIIKSGISPTLI